MQAVIILGILRPNVNFAEVRVKVAGTLRKGYDVDMCECVL